MIINLYAKNSIVENKKNILKLSQNVKYISDEYLEILLQFILIQYET